MPRLASGARKSAEKSKKNQMLTLLDLGQKWFRLGDRVVNAETATDAEFDAFIRQFVQVGWSLEDRRDALNFAMEQEKPVPLLDHEPEALEA